MPTTNLSLQRIGDFEKSCDNSLLVKKCCAKKAGLAQSKVEGTKLQGLMTSCHFLKTRKLETENVHLNQVFSIRLVTLFYCILSALVCRH